MIKHVFSLKMVIASMFSVVSAEPENYDLSEFSTFWDILYLHCTIYCYT